MKSLEMVVLITLVSVFMFAGSPSKAEDKSKSSSLEEHNKSIVFRYFHDVLDGKQFDIMSELFTTDIVMHRPEGVLSNLNLIQPGFNLGLSPHTLTTTIHDIFASGDRVFVRLSHQMTYSSVKASFRSRIGDFDVSGETIFWDAMAIFRFSDGKIAEEWICRDELGMLMQVGKLELTPE